MKNALTGVKFSGGELGIRTLDTLLGHTRFPIVLLRPARTALHHARISFNTLCENVVYNKLVLTNK